MDSEWTPTTWHEKTFDHIEEHSSVYNEVGEFYSTYGLSALAIAGAMAKENNNYQDGPGLEAAKDLFALHKVTPVPGAVILEPNSHADYQRDYHLAEYLGYVDNNRKGAKLFLDVLMDLGPFNTQGANAIRMLYQYRNTFCGDPSNPTKDPLDLLKYEGRLDQFMVTISGLPIRGYKYDPRETVRVNAAIWGMSLLVANAWFESKFAGDPQFERYWNSLSENTRFALIAQRAQMKADAAEKLYEVNKQANGGTYKPAAKPGDSSASNYLHNSPEIMKRLTNPGGQRSEVKGSSPTDPQIQDRARDRMKGIAAGIDKTKKSSSPLVLDLDGDGVETTGLAQTQSYFDHDANGFAEKTGWVSPDDGLLVLDRNENGSIDNGRELFGDETLLDSGSRSAHGFSALRELDSNANGRIDGGDDAFGALRIWKDLNSDGRSESNEIFSLDDVGIVSIDTADDVSTFVDLEGNAHKQTGVFTRADGSTGDVADVWFTTSTTDTKPVDPVEIPEEMKVLPNLPGFGDVPDLWQAIATDETGQLRPLVERFSVEEDETTLHQIVRDILSVWTGAISVDVNSRGAYVDGQTMHIVESFTGSPFQGKKGSSPTRFEVPALLDAYTGIHEMYYGRLMAMTHFRGIVEGYSWDDEAGRLQSDTEFLQEVYLRFQQTGEIDPELFKRFPAGGAPGSGESQLDKDFETFLMDFAYSMALSGFNSPFGYPEPRSRNSAERKKKLELKLTSSLPWVFTSTAGQYSVVSRASDKCVNDSNESDYNRARTIVLLRRPDPLILDLDGDGIEMMTISSSTYFDLDGNGFAERTAWIRRDDGFLVLDRNGDGDITNGYELFGDNTVLSNGQRAANGFEALGEFDANHDGTIDANDPVFSSLRIWRDDNADGISTHYELHDLSSLGLRSINLTSQITNSPDGEGNTIIRSGSFVREDGTQSTIAEYRLQSEPVQTREVQTVAVSAGEKCPFSAAWRGAFFP